MAISQEFAPPFKLIAPYFIIGAFVYLLSVAFLFQFDITTLNHINPSLVSWIHLLLLGFVMMIIFGAMAQLIPVVLEVGHFAVELYYVIYPLLSIGTLMMVVGFAYVPALLPFGGVVVLIALLVFVFETFMTIVKVEKMNLVMSSVALANSFLMLGLIYGIVMALGYAGTISVDIMMLLKAHIYLVLIGYVGTTIMGMSMVLLPMFWLSHSFSWKSVTYALYILSFGIMSVVLSTFFESQRLEYFGYSLTVLALVLYFYQTYVIYKTRVRVEKDIYLRSVVFAFVSLISAIVLGVLYFFSASNTLLLATGFVALFGYVTFMIVGHLYKIVPFLVWYERFSPFVGKRKVPILADMLPKRSADLQYFYSVSGVVISTIGILMMSDMVFKAGVSILFMGAIFVLKDLLYMINYKE